MTDRFGAARALLAAAVAAGDFPAATIEVGRASGPLWQEAFGRLSTDANSPDCRLDTIFDLASLTKVIGTASLTMRHVEEGRLAIDDRLSVRLPSWRGADRERVTLRELLDHSSGLPAHERLFERLQGRAAFERTIVNTPLDYPPGSKSIYSDVGFMLLGFVLEDAGRAPLDDQFRRLSSDWTGPLLFRPTADLRPRIAPTEIDSWRGRVIVGEVHDENAAALDGVAGHAGLFGTVESVGAFARLVLRTFHARTSLGHPALMRTFAARSTVPESSRALAWDTMKPTSSCGSRMSPRAIGHTGFTGTSLWIDEESDGYVVLLTNRVHPTRTNDALVRLRPRVHDAIDLLSLGQ